MPIDKEGFLFTAQNFTAYAINIAPNKNTRKNKSDHFFNLNFFVSAAVGVLHQRLFCRLLKLPNVSRFSTDKVLFQLTD